MRNNKAPIKSKSGNMTPLLHQQSGRIKKRVFNEILGDITDLIAGESVLLRGSEDQTEAIEKDLTEWQDALTIAEKKEGSSDQHDKFCDEIRELALGARQILNAFIANRKRQTERTCFIKFVFFFDDLIAERRFKKEITEIRVSITQQLKKVHISRLEIGQPSASSPDDFTKESETEVDLCPLGQFDDKLLESQLIDDRLSDEEGWEFFKTKVQVPDVLETIGKAIVRRCVGIPQIISETGASLSRKEATVEQWEMQLKELKRNQASSYGALSEAANALPSNLKRCLFYFGLFKEDYNIPARRLVVLWVAEGLVQERNNEESPESIAEKHLQKLVEQEMIQVVKRRPDGRVKTCRMHIALRDLWESKAKNANFFHIDSKSTSTSIRRLADHLDTEHVCFPHIHGSDRANISDFQSHYKNLCTFLSFDTREGNMPGDDIGNFLDEGIFRRCFQGLRVLDLERVFRPKLPESIGKLIHLRYLGLRWTYLERLPTSINNLLNLQTLDLKNTYISVIPSSLWQMRQLRHLYLSEDYRSRFVAPKGASPLTNLQTLWGAFVDDEVSVDGLFWLTNLTKLGLVFQLETLSQHRLLAWRILGMKGLESLRLVSIDKSVKPSTLYFDSLSDLENLSSLYLLGKVENFSSVYLPGKLPGNLPGKLTDLTLSLSKLDADPMEELGKLQNLKILKLFCNAYSKRFMRCRRGSFPVLQVLKVWKQENLEDWFLDEGSLKVLRELEIRRCENLKELPYGIEHLSLLRNLTLTDMPKNFTDRVKEYQGEYWEKIAHVPSLNIIPLPDMTHAGEGSSSQN